MRYIWKVYGYDPDDDPDLTDPEDPPDTDPNDIGNENEQPPYPNILYAFVAKTWSQQKM